MQPPRHNPRPSSIVRPSDASVSKRGFGITHERQRGSGVLAPTPGERLPEFRTTACVGIERGKEFKDVKSARVELGRDGVLHVLAGPVTLHMDRATCEELTPTLARAVLTLAGIHPKTRPPRLALVHEDADGKV